tara:strand:+ start:979 stop:1314 length:336 start_codon:yes stop_codon:yes gene_type:complete
VELGLDKSVKYYSIKKALLKSSNSALLKALTIEPSHNSQNLMLTLAFGRFLMFETENLDYLIVHNNNSVKTDYSHYPGFNFSVKGFHGLNLFPHSLSNERSAWEILYGIIE